MDIDLMRMADAFCELYDLHKSNSGILSSRYDKMLEEVEEFNNAKTNLEQFDALLDILYATAVTASLLDFPIEEGLRRIHKANMNKERGPNNSVIKPAGWEPASLEDLCK